MGIVIYIICLIVIPYILFRDMLDAYDCYDTLYLYYSNDSLYEKELAACGELLREGYIPSITYGIGVTIVLHYIFQFVFFKIIIDFIYLGSKK